MKYGLFNEDEGLLQVGTIEEINEFWSDFSDDYETDSLQMFVADEPVDFNMDEGNIEIESEHDRFVLLDGDDCQVFSGTRSEVEEYCREWWEENGDDYDFSFETVVPLTETVSFSIEDGTIVID
jgi:hypothetical protein